MDSLGAKVPRRQAYFMAHSRKTLSAFAEIFSEAIRAVPFIFL
jgi:hypothetical protein